MKHSKNLPGSREFKNVSFELKALNAHQFEGHGSVFNNVDYGGDIVLPGAFASSLKEHKANDELPQMFWMHKMDQVPGKWLDMAEDSKGLYVKGELLPTTLGNDMQILVKNKAVRGLSIGFTIKDREWVDDDDNGVVRLIKDVDLWEVSLVSLAMNPLAQVEAVKARLSGTGEFVQTKRDFEKFLRDHGYSRSFAETIIAKGFAGYKDNLGDLDSTRGEPESGDETSDEEKALLELANGLAADFFGASIKREY